MSAVHACACFHSRFSVYDNRPMLHELFPCNYSCAYFNTCAQNSEHPIGVIFIANCSTHVHLNYNHLLHVCRACMCMFSLKVFSLRQPTDVARIVSMQVSMRILQHMCTKFCTPHWCYLYCKL